MNIFYAKTSAFVLYAHSRDFQWSKRFNFGRDATGKRAYVSIKADRSLNSFAHFHTLHSVHLINFIFVHHSRVSFPRRISNVDSARLYVAVGSHYVVKEIHGPLQLDRLFNGIARAVIARKKSQLFVNLFNEPRFCRSRLLGLSSEDDQCSISRRRASIINRRFNETPMIIVGVFLCN